MALARSTYQSLWTFGRHALPPLYTAASGSRCSRCNIRHYSDQQAEVALVDDQQQAGTTAGIPTSLTKLTPPKKNRYSQLLADDVHSQPGLSALDELNPSNEEVKARLTTSNTSNDYEVWKETLQRILSSFNYKQLDQMRRDAQVPNNLFKLYRLRRGVRIPKPILVKALMIHRFYLKDSELEAEIEAAKARSKQNRQTVKMPLTQIALLLLVLRGQSEMQRLLKLHRVKLTPLKKKGEENPSLQLAGAGPSIEIVREFIVRFCESIRSISCPLSSFTVSSRTVPPPSDQRLRLISQRSQTIVSLDEDGQNVTIYSVEDASLNAAQSLLVQAAYDDHLSQRRQLYSYASPPIPSDVQVSVPTYGFVPHVGPTPLPWLADPGSNASLFRLTRQDIVGADDIAFSNTMQDNPDAPNLRSIKTAETYDLSRSAATKEDAFNQLREQLRIPAESIGSCSYTAEFGHLLFDNLDKAGSSRVTNLVTPPLGGTWPLEHGLEWLRKAAHREEAASCTPSFCSVIPPLAASMDAGRVPSVNSYSFSSTTDADLSPEEKYNRKMQYWAEQLQLLGMPLRSNAKHELVDIVDVDSSTFSDVLLITFAGDRADLSIQLRVNTAEGQGGMVFQRAQWIQRATGDVLVPESSIDLRLGVAYKQEVSEEIISADEGLQRYLEEQKGISAASIEAPEVEERAAVLPQTGEVQGQKVFLVSAKRVCRWEWELFDDKVALFKGKLVMQKAIQDEARDNASTFKIVFDDIDILDAKVESADQAAVGDQTGEGVIEDKEEGLWVESSEAAGSEASLGDSETSAATLAARERSVWRVMQPLLGFFLARGYRSLPR